MDREMLGRFIAQRRKERNMTQRELAEKLHVTDKAVSKWERGAGCPDISLLEPLAEALELSVDQLLTYQTAPEEPEAAVEPVTSPAVQAVLDLTLEERRARRRRRWFIAMAVTLSLIVLAVVYVFLSSLQARGDLFRNESSTSPDGSITVVTYAGSFGNPSVRVTKPADMQRRWGDGSVNAGVWANRIPIRRSPACTGRRTAPIWPSAKVFVMKRPTLTARFGISIRVRMSGGMAKQWAA